MIGDGFALELFSSRRELVVVGVWFSDTGDGVRCTERSVE